MVFIFFIAILYVTSYQKVLVLWTTKICNPIGVSFIFYYDIIDTVNGCIIQYIDVYLVLCQKTQHCLLDVSAKWQSDSLACRLREGVCLFFTPFCCVLFPVYFELTLALTKRKNCVYV